jgi:hypothetical protein
MKTTTRNNSTARPDPGAARQPAMKTIGLNRVACGFLTSIVLPLAIADTYPSSATRLWPSGVIPYQYSPEVTANQRCCLEAAMAAWEAVANVDFRPRNGEADYLFVRDGDTGPSYPPPEGYRAGSGAHILNLDDWAEGTACGNHSPQQIFGLAHEVGHALGLYHTHQRQDRDEYFTYNDTVTDPAFSGNYDIANNSLAWPRSRPDIDSIMSYPLCVFSTCEDCQADPDNCSPITLLPPYDAQWADAQFCTSPQAEGDRCLGQRNHLSVLDGYLMSFLYPQTGWVFVDDTQPPIGLGTFHHPYNAFSNAYDNVPVGGKIWILDSGTYHTISGTLDKPLRIEAPLGGVILRP